MKNKCNIFDRTTFKQTTLVKVLFWEWVTNMQNQQPKTTHTYSFQTPATSYESLKPLAKQTINTVKEIFGDTNIDNIDIHYFENQAEIMMIYYKHTGDNLENNPDFGSLEPVPQTISDNVDLNWSRCGITSYRLTITISPVAKHLPLQHQPSGDNALQSCDSLRSVPTQPQGQNEPPTRHRRSGSILGTCKTIAAFGAIPIVAHSIWALSNGL